MRTHKYQHTWAITKKTKLQYYIVYRLLELEPEDRKGNLLEIVEQLHCEYLFGE